MRPVEDGRAVFHAAQHERGREVERLRAAERAGQTHTGLCPLGAHTALREQRVQHAPMANRWFDLMDINAGTIATGEETIEEVGWKLFHFILDVASGKKKTFSDQWGLHNQLAVFNPAPVT